MGSGGSKKAIGRQTLKKLARRLRRDVRRFRNGLGENYVAGFLLNVAKDGFAEVKSGKGEEL